MATLTVGNTGTYAGINAAIAAATGGDTISILADYDNSNPAGDNTAEIDVTKDDLSFIGATGDPADVVVENSDSYGFKVSTFKTGLVFRDITIKNNKSAGYALYAGFGEMEVTNCNITGFSYGVAWPGTGCVFQRCTFKNTNDNSTSYGIRMSSPCAGIDVNACLFLDWGKYAIYTTVSSSTWRNLTLYSDPAASQTYLIRASSATGNTFTNIAIYAGSNITNAFYVKNDAATTVKNCVSFGGATNNFSTMTSAVTANLYDQSDVTADGNPVFVALGTDFHPDPSGLAYHNGLAAGAPAKDLDDNDFDSPPSIGCLEAPAAPGGGGGGAVMNSRAGLLPSPFTLTP